MFKKHHQQLEITLKCQCILHFMVRSEDKEPVYSKDIFDVLHHAGLIKTCVFVLHRFLIIRQLHLRDAFWLHLVLLFSAHVTRSLFTSIFIVSYNEHHHKHKNQRQLDYLCNSLHECSLQCKLGG